MPITYHDDLIQGSDEWLQLRCGKITASEVRLLLTPTLKVADNDKVRAHLYELLAQRVTGYVEPHYVSDDMLRGIADEGVARDEYAKLYGEVETVGFVTNDKYGFTIGYSPDGLVNKRRAAIECKSRRAKFQIQTIIDHYLTGAIPAEFLFQCQTGISVAELEWVDLVSYSGGLPMTTMRVWPDDVVREAIINAAGEAERKIAELHSTYLDALNCAEARLVPTERTVEVEMFV